ncbi:hypothetical protein [Geomicrobium sp. JCM 19055]|uniref:hypothetical protein n=1 Tax=Geomicrobium sp. JCM 19055 TaxID=1460649 RepID=UPI000A8E4BD6|nr:hypothetical protein [Geomicrobium sp. JCM 19055]
MFKDYLVYKKSWIGLISLLLLLTNVLIQVDVGVRIQPYSLLYLNLLFLTICVGFFIWRYKKETSYYKHLHILSNDLSDDWFGEIPEPENRFPDSTVYNLLQNIHNNNQKKHRQHQNNQLIEHDDIASWVHEVKTPLTAMKITIDANRSNELAQRLNAQWLRMHLLIDRQLYISRLAYLESDLLPEKQVVKDLIREEIRELSTWCMEKKYIH